MKKPEDEAREKIDAALVAAGWEIQDAPRANVHARRGVAIREFPLKQGHGFADYLLYLDGKAAGVVEAKREASTLTGVATHRMVGRGRPRGEGRRLQPRWFRLVAARRRSARSCSGTCVSGNC